MHVTRKDNSSTEVTLTISAGEATLAPIKDAVVKKLAPQVKIAGFREGKAPVGLIEKNLNPTTLQTEFLDEALTVLYMQASQQENIRPVTRPDVQIKKFVPFTELEYDVTTGVIGKVKLPDYKKIKVKKERITVTDKDVTEVLASLKTRLADKIDVERSAKDGDQVWIDFSGFDSKGEVVNGADGKDYPLLLGSKTFIPGFEEELLGTSAGDKKEFTLTFPKDYGVKAMANKKVTFKVTVNKVQEVIEPKEDDDFAQKAGPFKTIAELKADIKTQLETEREREVTGKHQDEVVKAVTDKATVAIPDDLIEQQINYNLDELKRNLTYRGQTLQEYLEGEGKTEEEFRKDVLRPDSERQIKTSLVLAEIADKEGLTVTPEELEIRIQLLKGQYQDQQMQAELNKEENRRDIANRLLNEKVVELLTNI